MASQFSRTGRERDPRPSSGARASRATTRGLKMPIVGPDGYPRHDSGVVDGQPGLYFVGLPYQTRLASGLVGGVGRDAIAVADVIAGRLDLSRRPAPASLAASEGAAL